MILYGSELWAELKSNNNIELITVKFPPRRKWSGRNTSLCMLRIFVVDSRRQLEFHKHSERKPWKGSEVESGNPMESDGCVVIDDILHTSLFSVKTRAKVNFLRNLDSNSGLAQQLAAAETLFGDYHEMFRRVEKIEAITAEDIQRVVKKTFIKRNRIVAMIVPPEETN